MQNTDKLTTDFLLKPGTVADVKTAAKADPALSKKIAFNSHIHLPPNFSAFETVEQAVTLAAEQNVNILGCGNYYDFSVYKLFTEQCLQKDIFPLFGTEIIALETNLQQQNIRINDPGNPGKYYVCGKGICRFDSFSHRAKELIGRIRRNDAQRMHNMAEKMNRVFAEHGVQTGLDDAAVIQRVVKRHNCDAETVTLQERHLAQAFQEVFFEKVPAAQHIEKLTEVFGAVPKAKPDDAVGIQNEIRSCLMKAGKPCFVAETFVNLTEAKELILELGGIPCYPVLADGAKERCEYETPLNTLLENLKTNHYAMAEFIPIRNKPDVLSEYVSAIRKAGIVVVAGTEHNTLDLLPIAPTCTSGASIPDDVQAIFLEGVCVLVAHQFLCAHGEPGFVQSYNETKDKEALIQQFETIGTVVLNRYFQ